MRHGGAVQTIPLVARWMAVAGLWLACGAALPAQNILVAEHNGTTAVVCGAKGARPVIERDGRRVVADGYRVGLKHVDEYLPVFVSVRDVSADTSAFTTENSSAEMNNQFNFRANFESAFGLDNVFLVLDLRSEKAERLFFIYEIGHLEPRVPQRVAVHVPMSFSLGSGKFTWHVFVDGAEVLQSGIPVEEREAALDRMVAKRVAALTDADLQLFVGPAPEYPERLRKTRVTGRALVAIRVTARGQPVDVVAKEATDPAFGEAAVAAVRQWRFLPQVRHGRPVATAVEVPFDFAPPAGEK